MKLASHVTILAALSGAYAMVVQRSKSLPEALNEVTRCIDGMDVTAKSFNGDAGPVLKEADKVIAAIKEGQAIADGVSSIGLISATYLLQPVQNLNAHAKALFSDMERRVPDVARAKRCGDTRARLRTLNSSGQKMIDTILNKIQYDFARQIALPYTNNIKKLLAEAQDLFAESRCNAF